jgi:hypothetical protein
MTTRKRPNLKKDRIWLGAYPPDHAEAARRAGYYIEAIQVLHSWIEVKLQEWLLLSRHQNIRGSIETVWESAFGIPLLQVAKALFVTGKMNKTTFDAVCRFNAMRNKVIHKLFHENYDGRGPSISVSEYSTAFEYGIQLSNRLEWHLARLATRGTVRRDKGAARAAVGVGKRGA